MEIIIGFFIPLFGGVAFAFAALYYSERAENKELIQGHSLKTFPECTECWDTKMPVTYPNEGCHEQICWECLAKENWKRVQKLEKQKGAIDGII